MPTVWGARLVLCGSGTERIRILLRAAAAGPFLLATAVDGKLLDGQGPQLVSPGDGCGARYVSALTRIDAVLGPPCA